MKVTLLILLALGSSVRAGDLSTLCADRAAIERVYYHHRLGDKPPFEQVSPPALIERLVKEDRNTEAVLQKNYRVAVTPALLDAEVQRINTTTRAPEILAEIKTALGNDPARFANVFAKPILVERLLREKFANDDKLHVAQRNEMAQLRERLLETCRSRGNETQTNSEGGTRNAGKESQSLLTSSPTNGLVTKLVAMLKQSHTNEVSETTWQLGARPAETNAPAADEIEIKKRFGPNAQIISSPPGADKERKFYFEDVPAELQKVLRVQLRQPGDVSAVIETPGAFLLYLCQEKTAVTLGVATWSLPKRSYEQWLEEQKESR